MNTVDLQCHMLFWKIYCFERIKASENLFSRIWWVLAFCYEWLVPGRCNMNKNGHPIIFFPLILTNYPKAFCKKQLIWVLLLEIE